MTNNFLDNVGKFINESCCGYYSQGTSIQGGATPAMLRALKGMYAVDTPIDGINGTTMGTGNSIRSQVAKQAEYTLQQRNFLRYENFDHDFVTKLSYAYEKFYDEAKKRGLAKADVTREEFHVLISSYWTCVCEPFIHKMSWKKIEEHCRVMCRFFNWRDVILLKGEDDV